MILVISPGLKVVYWLTLPKSTDTYRKDYFLETLIFKLADPETSLSSFEVGDVDRKYNVMSYGSTLK